MEPNLRDERRRVVAALVRKFGSEHLEEALDATQDAFVAALQTWPTRGTPDDPTAWLIRTAERRLIEHLRRTRRVEAERSDLPASVAEATELALYRMACSSRLSPRERVCLVLRVCGGLTSAEIARLLHESEEAVQRRITRAKDKLRPDDLVPGDDWQSLLLILYLLFTEGYELETSQPELALSALRLAEEFASLLHEPLPELEALLALMYCLLARQPARLGPAGQPLLLEEQDPSRYDSAAIARGFWHLGRAQSGGTLSRYHIEAGLAAAIARGAPSDEVLEWHAMLAAHFPTPMARLGYALAIGQHRGWDSGLASLESLADDRVLAGSPYYLGAMGHALAALGRGEEAAIWYERAVKASMSPWAAELFERRIMELEV